MKSYTETEVTVSLSEADIVRLVEDGQLEEDGVTIEFFSSP